MSRQIGKLSALAVNKAKTKGLYSDGGGLYLRISSAGVKSWAFRYMLDGKSREMGLGAIHVIALAEARNKAADCRKLLLQKIDPIKSRKEEENILRLAQAKTITFKQCAELYISSHKDGWRNKKHIQQWENTLKTYAYPFIENVSVQDVDVVLVMKILEPIWKAKPETASRLRGRIEAILDWANAREYRKGENPARWRGHIQNLLPARSKIRKIKHHPALNYEEINEFILELKKQNDLSAKALEFLILTATRTSEVTNAKWDEINLEKKVWVIPAHRIKAQREHKIPLSENALIILKEMKYIKSGEYVFSGRNPIKPMSNMAMLELLKRMKKTDITIHGFRSTFRDWAAEQTNFAREVAEMALAHAVGDKVEAAYRRGDLFDKRTKLMEAWEKYCYQLKTEGKVLKIRG